MKKVKINNTIFNDAMKTIQGTLGKTNDRPILQKCKCEVDEQYIRFISLDGYSATILKFEHKQEDVEKFDFLFSPFAVSKDKQGAKNVTIEAFDGYVSFKWLDDDFNEIERKVKPFGGEYINIDVIYEGNRAKDGATIYVDANLLIKALKGFTNGAGRHDIAITFDKNDALKPLFIKSLDSELTKIETIVLPIRGR
jgi:hypothetical protein